jgi:hypothetical protein
MSIFVSITWQGEKFEIEIDDDLDMNFLNYDIQYDRAAEEFGYGSTPALSLLKNWKNVPIELIIEEFGLPRDCVTLLAADWAERVFPIFHRKFPYDYRVYEAVSTARKPINSRAEKQTAEAAWYQVMRSASWATGSVAHEGAKHAALAVQGAIHSAFSHEQWKSLAISAAEEALLAVVCEKMGAKLVYEYRDCHTGIIERAWQIRHGMKAVEYAQGLRKDWPSVEVLP